MKLNLWQWLGAILLLVGVALYIYEKNKKAPASQGQPTTQSTGK
jgi:drug/metabolite transporter (DMT)-like permease